jgi:glucose/arabinose dehydrogenase
MLSRLLKIIPLVILALLPFTVSAQDDETSDDVVTHHDSAPDVNTFEIVQVASGFDKPLLVTHAGDGTGRLFVAEQAGIVWIVQDGVRLDTPFIDLSNTVSQDVTRGYSERGLLGLAFHPDYAENSLFYVNYTDGQGTTRIVEYAASLDNPNIVDDSSAREIFSLEQPYSNHNGGHIEFGRDGYLYVSVGDGGAGNDPLGMGQNPETLLGTILRIDVNGADDGLGYAIPEDNPYTVNPALAPEIWAWGVRNVWRFGFDIVTGDLYLADVGQNAWEEVNFQPADSVGGENYGWPAYEGTHRYIGPEAASDVVMPILEYDHAFGCSITGGYVYRGEDVPALDGYYIFSDWCSGRIWAAYRDFSDTWNFDEVTEVWFQVSSFGLDEAGELYLVAYNDDSIYRFVSSGE